MTPQAKSGLIDRHQTYRANGDEVRQKASQQFFEHLGLISLLGDAEIHSLITSAAQKLIAVHDGFDNFYNEPPFADRLSLLTSQNRVPSSAQYEFVKAIIICAIGNRYGVSNAAMPTYQAMIRSFSPAEIKIMLDLTTEQTVIRSHIQAYASCRLRYKALVVLLDSNSVPTSARTTYDWWLEN